MDIEFKIPYIGKCHTDEKKRFITLIVSMNEKFYNATKYNLWGDWWLEEFINTAYISIIDDWILLDVLRADYEYEHTLDDIYASDILKAIAVDYPQILENISNAEEITIAELACEIIITAFKATSMDILPPQATCERIRKYIEETIADFDSVEDADVSLFNGMISVVTKDNSND